MNEPRDRIWPNRARGLPTQAAMRQAVVVDAEAGIRIRLIDQYPQRD